MPDVTINDETVNAAPGDSLLALARRKALHIWFVCDGRGLCQTCECRVLAGSENLSRPSKIELESMSASRREQGYRLGCQAKVAGSGPINAISVAEEMRRQAVTLVNAAEGTSWLENAGRLAKSLTRFALEFTRSIPSVAIQALPQIAAMPPDVPGFERYLRDTRKVMERVLRDMRDLRENAAK